MAVLHTNTSQRNTNTFLKPKIPQKGGQLLCFARSHQNTLTTGEYITTYTL